MTAPLEEPKVNRLLRHPNAQALVARWSQLSPRERHLVQAAAALIAVWALVALAVRPAWTALRQAPQAQALAQAQLDRLQALAAEAALLKEAAAANAAGAGSNEPRSEQAGVDDATREQLLSLLGDSTQVEAQGRQVIVAFEAASGEQVRGALMTVRSRLKVRLAEAELAPGAEGIRGRLRFEWLPD